MEDVRMGLGSPKQNEQVDGEPFFGFQRIEALRNPLT